MVQRTFSACFQSPFPPSPENTTRGPRALFKGSKVQMRAPTAQWNAAWHWPGAAAAAGRCWRAQCSLHWPWHRWLSDFSPASACLVAIALQALHSTRLCMLCALIMPCACCCRFCMHPVAERLAADRPTMCSSACPNICLLAARACCRPAVSCTCCFKQRIRACFCAWIGFPACQRCVVASRAHGTQPSSCFSTLLFDSPFSPSFAAQARQQRCTSLARHVWKAVLAPAVCDRLPGLPRNIEQSSCRLQACCSGRC